MGSSPYLAPEQLDDGEVGPPADLWALGATLYTAVEGRAPFDGSTTAAVMAAILTGSAPRPSTPARSATSSTPCSRRTPPTARTPRRP